MDKSEPRLKVGIVRHGTVVSAQVIWQDEALRGLGLIRKSGKYSVHSDDSPMILVSDLYVRGTWRNTDNVTAYHPFDTEAEAKDWVKNITALIHKINQKPAQAEPDDGSVQVIVAE